MRFFQIRCVYITFGTDSVCDEFGIFSDQCTEQGIIAVYDDLTVRLSVCKHLAFCFQDAFLASKKLDMRFSDICNNADIRLNHLCKTVDLAEVICAHFDYRSFVRFLKLEKCLGNTCLIVEVSDIFMSIEALRENCADEFFCRCFAYTACDTDKRNIIKRSVKCSEFLISFECIADKNDVSFRRLRRDRCECSLCEDIRDKCVSVETITFDRNKQCVIFDCAAVDGNIGDLSFEERRISHECAVNCVDNLL